MNHKQVMSQRQESDKHDPNPNCTAELKYVNRGFWDDVSWGVYICPTCHIRIAAVGGGLHWWNYVISDKSAQRLGVDKTTVTA